MGYSPGWKRGLRKLVTVQELPPIISEVMHPNKEHIRQKHQPAWMYKMLLDKVKHKKKAYRGWKQGQVPWEE